MKSDKFKSKGVVLFIVEGISDKEALGLPMSRLLTSDTVHFAMINGDCINRDPSKAIDAIKNSVRDVSVKYNYLQSDFIEIVHIIDTDGSFIPENRVISDSAIKGTEFLPDRIITSNFEETITRHNRRKLTATLLSETKSIMKIPYGIYFMSRNLEHVTQGIDGHVNSNNKVILANEFADKYGDDTKQFVKLLFSDDIAVPGSYRDTWLYIMDGTNSLKRKCNLCVLLEKYKVKH